MDPNTAIAGATARGNGACSERTLGELAMTIASQFPELEGVGQFYDPKSMIVGDGSFIYAFRTADGFRLVVTLGSGDCESGCIDKAYYYFETDMMCQPVFLGSYSRTYDSTKNCFVYAGKPLWDFPGAPPPGGACDTMPQDISGKYPLLGTGEETPCSTTPAPSNMVSMSVSLEVIQDPRDLGSARVSISGTGNDFVDGRTYAGTVVDSSILVDATDNFQTGGTCGGTVHVQLNYDVAQAYGSLVSEEMRFTDCATMDYCKGALHLELRPLPP